MTLGPLILTFVERMEITEEGVGAKFKSRTHLEKAFFIFLNHIGCIYFYILQKIAKKSKTNFRLKLQLGIINNA